MLNEGGPKIPDEIDYNLLRRLAGQQMNRVNRCVVNYKFAKYKLATGSKMTPLVEDDFLAAYNACDGVAMDPKPLENGGPLTLLIIEAYLFKRGLLGSLGRKYFRQCKDGNPEERRFAASIVSIGEPAVGTQDTDNKGQAGGSEDDLSTPSTATVGNVSFRYEGDTIVNVKVETDTGNAIFIMDEIKGKAKSMMIDFDKGENALT